MGNINNYFVKNIEEFGRLDKKYRIIIISIVIGIFVFTFLVSSLWQSILTSNTKLSREKSVVPTQVPQPAILSLVALNPSVKVSDDIQVLIKIDSPNQGIEAGSFVINYDPGILAVKSIDNAGYFSQLLRKEVKENNIFISAAAKVKDSEIVIPNGKGDVAQITFSAISATESTKVFFDRTKSVAATNGKNIIGKISDVFITVK